MRYRALACDYDGTLATHGVVDAATVAALRRLLASGRELIMVTGRELPELKAIFPELDLFRYVVAENGGLLYIPSTGKERTLAEPPAPAFVTELKARGVGPISVGRSIVATWEPHEATVLATIRDLGLALQVIFNKGAVMILPSGVNKATGLSAALREMHLSRQNVAAIGDAENDHAFFHYCRVGVAVANALPALKERAEIVTRGDHGRGVAELIDRILENDLADIDSKIERHWWRATQPDASGEVIWKPGLRHLLLRSNSAEEIETAQVQLAQFLDQHGFQFCLVRCGMPLDMPHLRHSSLVTVGGAEACPHADEMLENMLLPKQNVQLVFDAGDLRSQGECVTGLLDRLRGWSASHGRPHVVILPELRDLAARHLHPRDLLWASSSLVASTADGSSPTDIFPPDSRVVACEAGLWVKG